MKKILLTFLICIICIPSFFLVGCDKEIDNGINIPVYFEKVQYQVVSPTGLNDAKLEDFTHNKTDKQNKYTSFVFTGKKAWLYKMTLEKITFDIYANVDEEIEIKIEISNLKDGNVETSSSTYKTTIGVQFKKDELVTVNVPVNKFFESDKASTTIKIQVDKSYYTGDNEEMDMKFDLANFKVFGEHKK